MNIDQIINKQLAKTKVLEGIFTISEGKRKGKAICDSKRKYKPVDLMDRDSLLKAKQYYISLSKKCNGDKDCLMVVSRCTKGLISFINDILQHHQK